MVHAEKGWVYAITTKTHELVKIGYTDRDPKVRAAELNDTSSPHPHVVRYAALVQNPRKVEASVHQRIGSHRVNKEWFEISVEAAVDAIRIHAGEILYEEDSGDISQEQLAALRLKEWQRRARETDQQQRQALENKKAAEQTQRRAELAKVEATKKAQKREETAKIEAERKIREEQQRKIAKDRKLTAYGPFLYWLSKNWGWVLLAVCLIKLFDRW